MHQCTVNTYLNIKYNKTCLQSYLKIAAVYPDNKAIHHFIKLMASQCSAWTLQVIN